jgi:hypothetical protein
MRTHLLVALGLFVLTGAVYSQLTVANFCGFDDALELQRMAFHDPGTLRADLGTVLFNSYKYRPGMMTLNRIAFRAGNESARAFRLRNILAHMLVGVTLYGVGMLLFGSIPIAAIGALLFALNPLANQAVAGAVWVIAPADFCLILSFFLFLASLRAQRFNLLLLAVSIVIGSIGVLVYDPVIVVFGLIYLYLFVWLFVHRRKLPGVAHAAVLGALTILFLGTWFALRARYLPHGAATPAPLDIFSRNFGIYAAAPFQFVDPVLANRIFGTELPSEALQGDVTLEFLEVAAIPGVIFLWLIVSRLGDLLKNLTRTDVITLGFLVFAWGGSLLPYLFFNSHPSETYNYVGLMMMMLIFSRLLYAAYFENGSKVSRGIYVAIVAVIVFLYGAGVIVKNQAVHGCGLIYAKILETLPAGKLQSGSHDIVFADVPGEPAARPYGMYGYKGIESLGMGSYGSPGIEAAIQVAFHNPAIKAQAVDARVFARECRPGESTKFCFWVHSEGQVEESTDPLHAPPARP